MTITPLILATLTVWHTQDRAQAEILERLARDFTAETGITIQLETGLDLVPALLARAETGIAPDAVLAPSDLASLAAPLGLSEVPPTLVRGIDSRHLATVSLDGRIYGVPIIDGNHLMLYYDRKKVPQPPASWEDLRQSGRVIAMSRAEAYFFLPFLMREGGVPATQGHSALDRPACSAALKRYQQLVAGGSIVTDCDYACASDRFFDRTHALAVNGDWILRDAVDALGDDLEVAPLPSLDGTSMPTPRMTHALFFPRGGLSGDKAAMLSRLSAYLADSRTQRRWFELGGRVPANAAARQEVAASAQGVWRHVLAALDAARPLSNDERLPHAWVALRRGLHFATIGSKTAEAACAYMHDLIEKAGAEEYPAGEGRVKP